VMDIQNCTDRAMALDIGRSLLTLNAEALGHSSSTGTYGKHTATAVAAIKMGAFDYLEKPARPSNSSIR